MATLHFLYTHERSIVLTACPTWHQNRQIMWRCITEMRGTNEIHPTPRHRLPGKRDSMELQIGPQWYAKGIGPDGADLRGITGGAVLLVVDEAQPMPQEFFDAADGILTQPGASALCLYGPEATALA